MGWLAVANGYEVTLRDDDIVCRNAAGKELKSLPKAVRDDPAVAGLRQLTEWLDRHDKQCLADVERWMVRSLPVPAVLLAEVWADDAWANAARNLVVAPLDGDGAQNWEADQVGLLRDAGEKDIGIVNLDGETVRLDAEKIAIPHPVLLPDIEDLREFAGDLDVTQPLDQLFRETYVRPRDLDPAATSVGTYAGGHYDQLRHLTSRASSAGFRVRGGYAVCRVFEAGQVVEARFWVGSDDPYYATDTGDLVFTRPDGVGIPLGEVGPVAWSEGTRMAAHLYAGRVIVEESTP